jgi:hypothetical protein
LGNEAFGAIREFYVLNKLPVFTADEEINFRLFRNFLLSSIQSCAGPNSGLNRGTPVSVLR